MHLQASVPLGVLVRAWPKLSETFILEEVLGLERKGMDLRLYALAPPSDAVAHDAVARVRAPLLRVPAVAVSGAMLARHASVAVAHPVGYLRALASGLRRGSAGWRDFVRAGWLAAQLRGDGVAHLHVHFIDGPADIAQLAAWMSGIPFSISAHAKDIYLSRPADLRRKLQGARFTVTCTEANRSTLAAIAPQAAIRRMYHGVDGNVFHPARRLEAQTQEPPLLVAVGRLRAKKGLDTLLEACRLLRERGEPVRCEIVGYGEEHDLLERQIERANLGGSVRLAGKLPRDQVLQRYARASVFVQPSRIAADGDRDGIPNVLLEAMSMGLPVVATRVSGIPELVRDGVNGLLVEPDAPHALADAIARLLRHRDEAAAFGQAARATVAEAFDNDVNLRTLLGLIASSHACGAQCAVAG
jgi:glycosyltransferase involved in cell wall biosynthesis